MGSFQKVVIRGCQESGGGASGELLLYGYKVSVWNDEKILEIVVIVARTHTKKNILYNTSYIIKR